ncbi:hypothetical protein Glove_421g123 [Diversispora epigaea]|uniref:Galactose oxidase n=1 Tax=Diversispora epigaea TaxID=1348612 RepID=A0A397H001_9GLOM|nr:hypothetical protein Glove_421g123 [Diversispora epigaea]
MYSLYNLFKFIFYIIFSINSILCYDPPKRRYHNSVIIDHRLLIIGGNKSTTEKTYELIYLDLSQSFDNTNLPWNLIREGDLPIYTSSSTAIVGLDNSTIFLIGGFTFDKNTLDYDYSNPVYTYDSLNSKWNKPQITGDNVLAKQRIRGVIDDFGIIYIFGGNNATNFTTFDGNLHNEMNTLNTSSMTWKTLSITNNLPPPSSSYSASILPNGIIVYFGGQEENDTLDTMKNIKLFDTKENEWSYMVATGEDVDPRRNFASVLTLDGYIIIFGGRSNSFASVSPKLAVLNTNKSPYEWSIPSGSKVNSPPSIYGHTANLYNNYMIITFGYDIDNQILNSQVYFYDVTNNTWITSFNPNSPSPPSPSSRPSKFLKPLLIGTGIGVYSCQAANDDDSEYELYIFGGVTASFGKVQ